MDFKCNKTTPGLYYYVTLLLIGISTHYNQAYEEKERKIAKSLAKLTMKLKSFLKQTS